MNKIVVLSGQRFGLWTVVRELPNDHRGRTVLVKCDCGTERSLRIYSLSSGHSASCGCTKSEQTRKKNLTHGKTGSLSHQSWRGMRERCLNPNHKNWDEYGGRGITVCRRWDSFSVFLDDMGERPSRGHSLDRVDVNGNYEPSNCRWVTQRQQMRNTRSNRVIEFNGERLTITDWSERLGLSSGLLHYRLKYWPVERALTERPNLGRRFR